MICNPQEEEEGISVRPLWKGNASLCGSMCLQDRSCFIVLALSRYMTKSTTPFHKQSNQFNSRSSCLLKTIDLFPCFLTSSTTICFEFCFCVLSTTQLDQKRDDTLDPRYLQKMMLYILQNCPIPLARPKSESLALKCCNDQVEK